MGEAPGVEEDRTGIPFVGRSGRVLDAALARLPLPSDAIGVLNLLKCRPPGNRFDRSAARTCRPYLDRQLALLAPEGVVSLGAWALRTLAPGAPAVLAAAGQPRPFGAASWLFPMLHPAATLRAGRWRRRWNEDLLALARWLTESGR